MAAMFVDYRTAESSPEFGFEKRQWRGRQSLGQSLWLAIDWDYLNEVLFLLVWCSIAIFHHWHVPYVSPSLFKSMGALLIRTVNSNQLIESKPAKHVRVNTFPNLEHFRSYVEVWLLFCGLHQSIMNCWIWSSKESLWLEKVNVTDSEHCKLANTTNNMASAIYMYTAIQFIHDFRVFPPPKKNRHPTPTALLIIPEPAL